jgi:hypothetical protein
VEVMTSSVLWDIMLCKLLYLVFGSIYLTS